MSTFYQNVSYLSIEKFIVFEEFSHQISDQNRFSFQRSLMKFPSNYEHIVTQKEKSVNRILAKSAVKIFCKHCYFSIDRRSKVCYNICFIY